MKIRKLHKTQESIPVIGQGTGYGGFLAKSSKYSEKHVAAIKYGIDLGMTFIDTAEEYGMGEAEKAVGKAIENRRDEVFVATKVSSDNLDYHGVIQAAEGSLRRLQTDYIDLYQVHWTNPRIPLQETMKAMDKLIEDGKSRYVGVCNMSLKQLKEAERALSADKLVSVQAEYNSVDRSIETSILPYCQMRRFLTVAYSPLVQGSVVDSERKMKNLCRIARRYSKTPAQIVLNWLISHDTVISIPQSADPRHIRENAEASDFDLSQEDLDIVDNLFAPRYEDVMPEKIRIYKEGEGASWVYRTVEEALENRLGMVPSPAELANDILTGEILKPIKVKVSEDTSEKYDYDLIEGRLRYWGWVIAHGGEKAIRVLVRE